jgi:hypothetical protein
MRRRIVALALAVLVVAGCDASFGGTRCRDKGGDGPRQEQPAAESGDFQEG